MTVGTSVELYTQLLYTPSHFLAKLLQTAYVLVHMGVIVCIS